MAKSTLGKGKRRYTLSLTVANVEKFQTLAKQFGMPNNQMSLACDDAIREMAELFQTAQTQGKYTIQDLFKLIGQQMELLMVEERRDNATLRQERHPVPDKQGNVPTA